MNHRPAITILLILALLLPLSGANGAGINTPWRAEEVFSQSDPAIDRELQEMSLEEKAGQMLVGVIDARCTKKDGQTIAALEHLIEEGKIGGVMFLKGDTACARILADRFQHAAPRPLLLSADMEQGLAMRFEGATRFPDAMAVAATGDPELARRMGRAIAGEATRCGLHQNYAPCVDLNSNPRNPVIGLRSFGDSPAIVEEMAGAMIEGLQKNRIIATIKHFPGHGEAAVDSHLALPLLQADAERLEAYELAPFRSGIHQGVMSVMVGHLAVPALTGTQEPASVSRKVVTDLLRNDMGFQGLIITDALNMKALYNGANTETITRKALEAGNDLLLFPPDPAAAHAAILKAVREGRVSQSRIDDSVRRILQAKRWAGLIHARPQEAIQIETCSPDSNQALAREIATRSVTLLRDHHKRLPLQAGATGSVLFIDLDTTPDTPEAKKFEAIADSLWSGASHIRLSGNPTRIERDHALSLGRSAQAIIITTRTRRYPPSGKYGPSAEQQAIVNELSTTRQEKAPIILLALGSPYTANLFSEIGTVLCTWGAGIQAETAALQIIKGLRKPAGIMPVNLTTKNY